VPLEPTPPVTGALSSGPTRHSQPRAAPPRCAGGLPPPTRGVKRAFLADPSDAWSPGINAPVAHQATLQQQGSLTSFLANATTASDSPAAAAAHGNRPRRETWRRRRRFPQPGSALWMLWPVRLSAAAWGSGLLLRPWRW
jgi:hypothetical protein